LIVFSQPPFYSQNVNIMYQKILHGELRFPTYISEDAVNLLEGVRLCERARTP